VEESALQLALAGVAAALASVAVVAVLVQKRALRRLRDDQRVLIGDHDRRDLVAHAAQLQGAVDQLEARVATLAEQLDQQIARVSHELARCVDRHALVRYDAYNEMSGRQSASLALLDRRGNGLVLSSIVHREQARLYAKRLTAGKPDVPLSPEEEECVRAASGGDSPEVADGRA